jgi:hypothetical protein
VKLLSSTIAVAATVLVLLGCSNQPQTQSKADLLSESGFKVMSLNTPAKVASFKKLPPHRLTQTTFKGRQVWVYPDRNVCSCLYIGSQTAYDAYLKKATSQMIDTRLAQLNQDNDPYNPTQMDSWMQWDDPWDVSDAYGLYVN